VSLQEQLRHARKRAGKSAAECAKALGLTVHAYRRYERGEVEPKVSQAIALAEYFEVTLDQLLTDRPDVDDAQRMLVSVQPGQRVVLDVTGVAKQEQKPSQYTPKVELHTNPDKKSDRKKRIKKA
jgi:transcriptional regulator with XRE-family HTH domain